MIANLMQMIKAFYHQHILIKDSILFKKEIASLATWYDLSIQRRGRTTFGLSNSSK